MKKQLIKSMLTALTFGMLVSLNAIAAEPENEAKSDSRIIIGESNHISLTSENAEQNGITALQLSLLVEPAAEADVSFDFNQENEVKVHDFRYHEDSKVLNIYIADEKPIFNDSNLMDIGSVSATNTDGNSIDVEITVIENSLKFVSKNILTDKAFSVEDTRDTEPITTTTTTETTTTKPTTSTTTTTTETTTTKPTTSTTITTTETTTTKPTTSTTTTTTETTTTKPTTSTTTTTTETTTTKPTTSTTTTTTETTTTEPVITTEATTTESVITTETTITEPVITTEATTTEPVITTETTITEPVITTETTTTESITTTNTKSNTTTTIETTTTESITSTTTTETTNTECTTTTTLPQTGNNSLKNVFIAMASLMLVAYGVCAVTFSGIFRRKKDEK